MARSKMLPATIHYRRLEDVTNAFGGTNLQAAIQKALHKNSLQNDFHKRVFNRSGFSDSIFANQIKIEPAYAFGDLVHFTRGHMQALFQAVGRAIPQAPIKQMKAQDGEFIHSLLYWYIRGNHVFVLQARTVRTADLEDYLSWLLTDASSVLKKPLNVILRSKFDPSAVGGNLNDIEEIKIGGTIAPRKEVQPASDARIRTVIEDERVGDIERATERGIVRRVLEAMLGSESKEVDNFINRIDPAAELKLRVTIGLQARRTKIDRTPLSELEVGLRNLPDAEVSVKARNGKSTPLGQLQLTYPTSISVIESLWDPTSVWSAFERAYEEFVASGKIDGDEG